MFWARPSGRTDAVSSTSGSGPGSGDPVAGSRIGRFRIVEQLGQGGMGVVYRAMEENLGREVALKVIAPLFAHDPEFRERFTREARSQASLESAHVVAVYAHGEEDGYLYIASQLIPGGDLGHLIRTHGTPSLVEALEIIEQVTSGLSDAHDAGLVHRDIKPGNVLVRRRPGSVRAYLADFGIARKMGADATRFSATAVGTPSYMAPELHGGAKASASTDIYALGCLLWVALTGTPPFQGTSEYQLVAAHVSHPVPQLSGDSPMVNATNRILRTAMAKDAADRYQAASEMSADLHAALRLPVTPGAAVPEAKGSTAMRPIRPTPTPTPAPTPARAERPVPVTAYVPVAANPPPPAFLAATPTGRRTSSKKWWALGGAAAAVALGAGIGAALITGGDGGDDPSPTESAFLALEPKEILQASERDMVVLESARIRGQFDDDGSSVEVDVTATSRGDCKGTMTETSSGGVAEILRVGENLYLRADEKFWNSASGDGTAALVLPVIGDRWVLENSLLETTDAFCDLDEFLERDGREGATQTSLGEKLVGDDDAVKIEQAEGEEREVLYVRLAEPHYLLRIEESDVDFFEFSDFDKEAEIKAPPASDVFDLQSFLDKAEESLN